MESDSNLKTWVSDKLMTLLGYSQPVIVYHIIAVTKQTTSPAGVVDMLVKSGWSSTAETTSLFAEEIFAKVPHKASVDLNQNIKPPRVFRRKRYKLVDDDEEEQEPKQEERKKRRTCPEDDEEEDQRAREQLERNLKEKDKAATRKLTDKSNPNRRRSSSNADHDIEALRERSRQEYLKKREQMKLEQIRDEVEDENKLFECVKMTEAEKRRNKYKEQVLKLVDKYEAKDDDVNQYRIPEAYNDMESGVNQKKRLSVAFERYKDEEVCWYKDYWLSFL